MDILYQHNNFKEIVIDYYIYLWHNCDKFFRFLRSIICPGE